MNKNELHRAALYLAVIGAGIVFMVMLHGCAAPVRYCRILPPPAGNTVTCVATEEEICCRYDTGVTMCQVIRDNQCPTEWEER